MTLRQASRTGPVRAPSLKAGHVVLLGSGLAWVALATLTAPSALSALSGHGSGHAHLHPGALDAWSTAWGGTWLLMVAAMMWPLAVPSIDAVSRASFPGWRAGLAVTCLATVTLLWLAAGLAVATIAQAASVPPSSVWWQVGWVGVAAVVGRSPRRARLLWECLRLPPLAPGGRRGVVTAGYAGVVSWRRCALLCGPLMTAMVVGHEPVLMVCASLAVWWEAAHPRAWRDRVPPALLGACAAWLLVTAGLPQVAGRV